MFDAFLTATLINTKNTVLDVGATSDQTYNHSNYFEAWYPHKSCITAVGLDDAQFLEHLYRGVTFLQADGCALPIRDAAFDFVHSSAVLEHVGSHRNQVRFLGELWRVARRGIFVTTPNRWFPVEFHTLLPLLHWLPVHLYRKILDGVGMSFFAQEKNLNLLSRSSFVRVAEEALIEQFQIESVSLLGLPTNLLLIARKP